MWNAMSAEQRDSFRERWEMNQHNLTVAASAGSGDTPAVPRPPVQGEAPVASPLYPAAPALPVAPALAVVTHRHHTQL